MILFFYVIAAFVIGSALAVVLLKNAIYSALALVLNLLLIAVLFAMQQAHFLAAAQVIVYAGAIMVLVLFVLMLLNVKAEEQSPRELRYFLGALLVAVPFLVLLLPQLSSLVPAGPAAAGTAPGGSAEIGRLLFDQYLLPFELTSILIIAALTGAVVLGKRHMSRK